MIGYPADAQQHQPQAHRRATALPSQRRDALADVMGTPALVAWESGRPSP